MYFLKFRKENIMQAVLKFFCLFVIWIILGKGIDLISQGDIFLKYFIYVMTIIIVSLFDSLEWKQ